MNTFKAILLICAALSASCSGQYASQSGTQGRPAPQQPAASPPVASYTDLGGIKGQLPFASPSQGPAVLTGSTQKCTSSAASTSTTQICSCITVNAGQQTADNTGSNQASAPVATPISAPAQSFVAPAAASSSASQQGYASQSAPAQSGGNNRGPSMAAYSAAAAPANNNGGY